MHPSLPQALSKSLRHVQCEGYGTTVLGGGSWVVMKRSLRPRIPAPAHVLPTFLRHAF